MKIKQISLFLENKPGAMSQPCALLQKEGIDISTMMLADTKEYGILRIVTRDWEKAKAVLEAAGLPVKVIDVVAVKIAHRPGGLLDVLQALEKHSVNVEYIYAFPEACDGNAIAVFRFDNPDAAIASLEKEGIGMVDSPSLFA